MRDDILLNVHKPGRYIGHEWNLPEKDFDKSNIKFALCFPDLYEVGMSNLGIRIIYGILNNIPDVACERFFSCGPDIKNNLRDKNMGICSLESEKGLKEFDLIGFSLGHELGYTNALDILDMGVIPLKASLRDHTYPLVIAGGPCALNPEPLHAFFDLFVFGEAEEAIVEIVDLYRRLKGRFRRAEISKEDLLIEFAQIEGVYAPSLYEVTYAPEGQIEEFRPRNSAVPAKVKKRFIKNLDSAYFPESWLVPYIQIIHDRITLEIMRGCPNTCRFCQARYQYFPFRQRSIENILELASGTYKRSGYEEISLCGLSISDFTGVEELLKRLIGLFKERAVSISLPSIKPKSMFGDMLSLIATIKKTGLTFAPEAATERMRGVLNKSFDTSDFFRAIEQAYLCGYQNIKLYFMIGLPFEREEDLDGIVDFAIRVSQLRRQVTKRGPAQVNVSINTLIPKPHTPFQWFAMESLEGMKYKQDYLKKKIKKYLTCSGRQKRIKLSLRNPDMTFLEGVLSRGDRRLSEVILTAFAKGARFDAWDDHFSFEKWQEAFRENRIDPDFYLQEKSKEESLPWDFLDIGVNKEDLIKEADKVIAIK
ncbi:MAG: TIGR03960 family B12-binding radical SAM protein [Candidatus Omnitrophica bacterium]|nr:TIGR03960 family B12-binding radical SAM protein [Candidatus Omnitrophota bacterium]MDD5593035.1 TIGR03960 family B12-binding radical SAM protein [Candidatus Omnitrophota bacterium]